MTNLRLDPDVFESSIKIANLIAYFLMSPEEHRALREAIERRKKEAL